jgi:hypothetical protein
MVDCRSFIDRTIKAGARRRGRSPLAPQRMEKSYESVRNRSPAGCRSPGRALPEPGFFLRSADRRQRPLCPARVSVVSPVLAQQVELLPPRALESLPPSPPLRKSLGLQRRAVQGRREAQSEGAARSPLVVDRGRPSEFCWAGSCAARSPSFWLMLSVGCSGLSCRTSRRVR